MPPIFFIQATVEHIRVLRVAEMLTAKYVYEEACRWTYVLPLQPFTTSKFEGRWKELMATPPEQLMPLEKNVARVVRGCLPEKATPTDIAHTMSDLYTELSKHDQEGGPILKMGHLEREDHKCILSSLLHLFELRVPFIY